MRRSTYLLAGATALAALVFCPEVKASEPSLWQYLYPGTKTIAGIDLQRAKDSPAGKMLARQWSQAGGFKLSGNDLDIFNQIDRVLISANGVPMQPGAKPPAVVAIQGRLSRVLVQKMAPQGTAIQKFKGADLFVPLGSKADDPLLALVSEQFAVLGDRQSLALVLDSLGTANADQEVLARAMQLAAECEVFVVSRQALSETVDADSSAMPAMKQLQDLQSVDLGISLARGLGLKGQLVTKDAASAQSMAMMTQLISTMVLNDPKQANSELGRIMRSLKVASEGSTVNLSLEVSLAQLERGVAQMRASVTEAGQKSLESLFGVKGKSGSIPGLRPAASPEIAQAKPVNPVHPPPAPSAPVKRTIKIVGLDAGEKEISYTSGGGNR